MASQFQTQAGLMTLDTTQPHDFIRPVKRINEGHDVPHFLTSLAYRDIGTFITQLNVSMCPRKISGSDKVQTWQLDSPLTLSEPVRNLQLLLRSIDSIIEEAPPDPGPRRFGNISFRKWYGLLETRVQDLFKKHLPPTVLDFRSASTDGPSVLEELTPYLLGGFGSAQRLDYGTGHELSFLAFLGCIWKIGGFEKEQRQDGTLERSLVVGVIEPYLRVVRRLILTYTLEPAGSHGVWGLDDHSFVSYIFGSSQYCPPIAENESMPVEGALPGSPDPGDVAKKPVVDRERQYNMYFSAVGFINDVKTGPFWEHSPMLFDISGVRSGWGKINKGMIKMYNAEVLSKFPVVQHFPFGSLFSWEQDPEAALAPLSAHVTSHPNSMNTPNFSSSRTEHTTGSQQVNVSTKKPGLTPPTRSPSHREPPMTRAPWAQVGSEKQATSSSKGFSDGPTRAPWAKKE